MAQGGCRGNAALGGARLCSAARPSACPALLWAVRPSQLLQQMSSLNETQHQPISCCYRTSISGKLSKKKKERSFTTAYFLIVKIFFFTWIQELLEMVMCPSLPHFQVSLTAAPSVSCTSQLFAGCWWCEEGQGLYTRGWALPTPAFSIKEREALVKVTSLAYMCSQFPSPNLFLLI